jgi:putative (di)nucleoside polyphosphate hydrolase
MDFKTKNKQVKVKMQSQNTKPDYLYRSGVGIMVINKKKQIFVGKRIDNNSDAWQMPQGGLDAGESEEKAMHRELEEETGISEIKVIAQSTKYFYYNLPYRLQKKFWGGKYLGQKQRWYLVQYLGKDENIDINTECAEFSDWKWVDLEQLTNVIVSFKKDLYLGVIDEFKEILK